MNRPFRYLQFAVLLILPGCTKDAGKINRGNFPDDIGKLFSLQCSVPGCHNSQSSLATGGLNLDSWENMFKGSNSGSAVIPYSSKFSSLCYYINTYPDLGLQNIPAMPLNRKPLSKEEVKLVMDWIDRGAPDIKGNVKWAENPKRKKLYAVNQGCDAVTVFDSDTQLPIRFISVGYRLTPHHLRVSPDGNYWYLIFINSNVMQKYRCSDDSYVGDIPLTPLAGGTGTANARDWNTFVISDDGKRAYCVSWTGSGSVAAVDLENRRLLHYIGGLHFPHGIALNAAGDKIYVGAQTGNFITEIDTGFTDSRSFALEDGPLKYSQSLDPHDIILSADTKSLVITCQQSNEVRLFNLTTHSVTVIKTGVYPQEVVYSKSTNEYFVSCPNDTVAFPGKHGVITRIKASGLGATHIACGFQPHGIAVDETKRLLYVLSRNIVATGPLPHHTSQCEGRNGFVNFIDLGSFTLLNKKYELSVDPYFIFARP